MLLLRLIGLCWHWSCGFGVFFVFIFFLLVGFNLLETSRAKFANLPTISLLLTSNLLDAGSIPRAGGAVPCPAGLPGHPWRSSGQSGVFWGACSVLEVDGSLLPFQRSDAFLPSPWKGYLYLAFFLCCSGGRNLGDSFHFFSSNKITTYTCSVQTLRIPFLASASSVLDGISPLRAPEQSRMRGYIYTYIIHTYIFI